MYCKNCGKEIQNDSVYCSYCGTKQIGTKNPIDFGRIVSFYKENKIKTTIYVVWLLIHLSLWIFSNPIVYRYLGKGNRHYEERIDHSIGFYPFNKSITEICSGKDFKWGLLDNINSYDFSEFFFYTIIVPIFVFCIFKLYRKCVPYIKAYMQIHKQVIVYSYGSWCTLNCFLFIIASFFQYRDDAFYPFTNSLTDILFHGRLIKIEIDRIERYGLNEFIFYTIAFPVLVLAVILFVNYIYNKCLRKRIIYSSYAEGQNRNCDNDSKTSNELSYKIRKENVFNISKESAIQSLKTIWIEFVNSVKEAYIKMFETNGCTTRKGYWYYQLFAWPIIIIWLVLMETIVPLIGHYYGSVIFYICLSVFMIFIFFAYIIPIWSITIRRLHDSNYSGWFILWGFIPCFLGEFVLLIFMLLPSDPKSRWRNNEME